ncbi:glycosyltransferase family 2 protein [Pectinatus sottacetonis]|uniref:glycosyltransferase family 2 protein n=1 Tax=Pectinatus sottacetonis TaxID=1002795 RepID=UPI0018C68878|nr:glycosyltransferase family 2 protein [Pectinatus sottacetonis]
MKISACVIVKNEAVNIQTWLCCMKKIADELIVVDTGSADDTKQMSSRAGAKVYDFIWQDDFAAAKNYAISKAKGDWVLFFDADEYFSETVAKQLQQQLLIFLHNDDIEAFLCKLVNIDKDKNNKFLSSFYQLRIFKNKPGIAYEGAIHEELKNKGRSLRLAALPAEIYAYHTGYSASVNATKLERNLIILQQQINRHGEDKKLYPYLATCYFGLKQYEKTIYYLQEFINSGINMLGAEVYVFIQYIDALELAGCSHNEVEKVLAEGLKRFPKSPDLNYKKGIMLFSENKFSNAEKYLHKALLLYADTEQLTASKMDNYLFMLYGILAQINALKKDNMAAVKYYVMSLQKNHYSKFFGDFCRLIRCYPVLARIKLLDKIYNHSGEDLQFLLQYFKSFGDRKLIQHYEKFLPNKKIIIDKNLRLFLDGQYKELTELTANTLDSTYRIILSAILQGNGKTLSEEIKLILPSNYQKVFFTIRSKLI